MNHSTPFKARPTTYKGIEMRSRTEATYAAHLDKAGLAWEYEPRCFADQTGQYLPDFRVISRSQSLVLYVEVKGVLDDVNAVQRRMEIIWASEPEAMLVLVILGTNETFYARQNSAGRDWVRWAGAKFGSEGARRALGGVRSAAKPPTDGAA